MPNDSTTASLTKSVLATLGVIVTLINPGGGIPTVVQATVGPALALIVAAYVLGETLRRPANTTQIEAQLGRLAQEVAGLAKTTVDAVNMIPPPTVTVTAAPGTGGGGSGTTATQGTAAPLTVAQAVETLKQQQAGPQ